MALERSSQDRGSLNAQTNTIVLNRRDSGLLNAGQPGQSVLTQLLQLADNANGFAN
jgi:hypothetical protein